MQKLPSLAMGRRTAALNFVFSLLKSDSTYSSVLRFRFADDISSWQLTVRRVGLIVACSRLPPGIDRTLGAAYILSRRKCCLLRLLSRKCDGSSGNTDPLLSCQKCKRYALRAPKSLRSSRFCSIFEFDYDYPTQPNSLRSHRFHSRWSRSPNRSPKYDRYAYSGY